MSGLDKFFKAPAKSQKKTEPKDTEKNDQVDQTPPRGGRRKSKKSSNNAPSAETATPALQLEEGSENVNELENPTLTTSLEDEDLAANQEPAAPSPKFKKFRLKCADKKCNYQRILMKPMLSSSDLTCPKCGNQMR